MHDSDYLREAVRNGLSKLLAETENAYLRHSILSVLTTPLKEIAVMTLQ
jgi:hypothetical protein